MSIDPVYNAVLRVAVDDWWGLWELLPEIEAALPPSGQTGIDAARCIVEEMLHGGLISLHLRDVSVSTPIIVEQPLADILLRDQASWASPERGGTEVLVSATEVGERLYYGQPRTPDQSRDLE